MPEEIPLTGGNITPIVRIGATVRRQPGPWTPAIHALLRHLETEGFEGAPRALGYDRNGREILSYIDGVAGYFDHDGTRPAGLWSDRTLTDAARWLRRFHDVTTNFVPPVDANWQLVFPDPHRHEVICHNDFAPYNSIFVNDRLHAVIDFDTAGPGPRVWDIAYAAYRFVPLAAPEAYRSLGIGESIVPEHRLKLFCDTYGFTEQSELLDVVEERIEATIRMLVDGAATGNAGYQRHLAEGGHIEGLQRDQRFVRSNAKQWRKFLMDS